MSGLSRVNRRKIFWLFNLLLSLLLSGLLIVVIGYYRDFQRMPPDHRIGNRESNVKAIEQKEPPFSFLVLGDTQGSDRLKNLLNLALKNGNYSFLIHLGDMVIKPDRWNHLFFLKEMTTDIKPPFPVFVVPGNHDVDSTSSEIRDKERRMTQAVFDSFYGARNFHFIYNHCLFILLEIDLKNPTGYLNYLRDVLSIQGSGIKYTFVFIHHPPKLFEEIDNIFPHQDEFFSLLETYKVTTCFFGHYHGNWRGQRNGVNYIIAGGGGRFKERQSEWGRFHHLLKVTVGEALVAEQMITLQDRFGITHRLNEWIFINFFPLIQNRGWILYGTTFLLISWGVTSLILFIKSLMKPKYFG